MDLPFLKTDKDGLKIWIRLAPNASSDSVMGLFQDADGKSYLKVSVRSPAVEGKANTAICAFLAKQLKIAKSSILLLSGFSDKRKCFLIKNADENDIKEAICKIIAKK